MATLQRNVLVLCWLDPTLRPIIDAIDGSIGPLIVSGVLGMQLWMDDTRLLCTPIRLIEPTLSFSDDCFLAAFAALFLFHLAPPAGQLGGRVPGNPWHHRHGDQESLR